MKQNTAAPVAGEPRTRIPDGQYEAVCFEVKPFQFYSSRKIVFRFRIAFGEHEGREVALFCNYPKGKIKPSYKLYRIWTTALGRLPYKGERFARSVFVNRLFSIDVQLTSDREADGTPVQECLRYSKVSKVLEALTGGTS